jgi:4-hydroxybenzoate polyprenyltransferase
LAIAVLAFSSRPISHPVSEPQLNGCSNAAAERDGRHGHRRCRPISDRTRPRAGVDARFRLPGGAGTIAFCASGGSGSRRTENLRGKRDTMRYHHSPRITNEDMKESTVLDDSRPQAPAPEPIPLFVDMDGTLLRTDMLVESYFSRVRAEPAVLLKSLYWLAQGRARLKDELANGFAPDPTTLPFHEPLCDYLREQAASGRPLFLATASDQRIARVVADHCGFFQGVLASDGTTNLKGERKLQAIREMIGDRPFAYAGNGPEDLPIWCAAEQSILVSDDARLQARVRETAAVEVAFDAGINRITSLLRAMRPHQWLKNLLVFVPLLASFTFTEAPKLLAALGAFVAFSLVASATYIFNDLLDLHADRRHPRKRQRPLAAGDVSATSAIALSALLLVSGFVVAGTISLPFAGMILLYLVMTVAYSISIKKKILADAFLLAALYTLRVLAGQVAIGTESSTWLLAFSGFVFFSLALVKRCAELKVLEGAAGQRTAGRDYLVSDLAVLWSLGVASAVSSVLIFALYISSPEVAANFETPGILWFLCPCLWYWIARMWIKTGRGEMNDDPLVFTATDRNSQIVIALMVGLFLAARYVS